MSSPITFTVAGQKVPVPLKFTINGFRAMHKTTGVNAFGGEISETMSPDTVAGFVLAGLCYVKKDMTLDEAGEYADQIPFPDLMKGIGDAMSAIRPEGDDQDG